MSEGDPMEYGELVMVETGPPGQKLHVVGRAIEPADPGMWWLSLNIGGVHLPQMYRTAEVTRSITPEMTERHGFCPACGGFGVPAGQPSGIGEQDNTCGTCGGSGRRMVTMNIERPQEGATIARVQIDQAAVANIECTVCRANLTPTPT